MTDPHGSPKSLEEKSKAFWNTDLKDLEPSAIYSAIDTMPIEIDERVPSQGCTLLDRPDYLPKD
ncbi:hypothetical protein [Candidatus Thiosymbion oneisti]|uniref:hypothetical protein n=1 Tax=Candidatus Thiosymbion oneisti TaxID=589554 RepID=UPI0015B4BEC7|nr:hypothetical protein [Candidatus Thiosymbion oneisti]